MIKIKKLKSKFHHNNDKTKSIALPAYTYSLDIFNVDVTIIFGIKNLDKYNNFFNYKDCEACCCNYLPKFGEVILFFRDKPNSNTIVHECVHACDDILEYLHHKHPNKSNELNANLTAHLVDVVLKAKNKYKKRSKKQ
jgi:hypothetical protein